MKKLLAMIMAVATACSLAVTSFAQTTDNKNEITVGTDENGIILNSETVLSPGNTYKFPLNIKNGNQVSPLDNATAALYSIKLEAVKGKTSLESLKVIKGSENHYLEIKVNAGWSAKQTNVEYNLKLTNKKDSKDVMNGSVEFLTGYKTASDDYINSLSAGEDITVDVNAPVFTAKQLERIAKLNDYKKVTFTDGNWSYNVNVTDMESVNMLFNTSAIKDIITKFDQHDFKFLSFPAGTSFSRGELKIDVADIAEDFEGKFFTYRYYKGVLTKVQNTFNKDEDTISMQVGDLGRFVICDKEIADGTVVEEGFGGSDNVTKPEVKPEVKPETPNKPNPETGSTSMPIAAAALAMISLAGMAILSKKMR
ncbi:MAG: hypothetical protein RR710_02125 [Oscillospiraceae bacterium]